MASLVQLQAGTLVKEHLPLATHKWQRQVQGSVNQMLSQVGFDADQDYCLQVAFNHSFVKRSLAISDMLRMMSSL
jgi:hypothetical protein